MTITIEKTNIAIETVVRGFSRYKDQNVIYYGEKRIITFDTYIRHNYSTTGKENVMLITKGLEYRPDLVSYDVFGTVDAWWKILEVNKMKDIWEFKSGTTIILPETIL